MPEKDNKTQEAKNDFAEEKKTADKTTKKVASKKEEPKKEEPKKEEPKKEEPKKEVNPQDKIDERIKAAQEGSSYLPEEKERKLYHIQLEKPLYDNKTGKRLSKPYIQKFSIKEYATWKGINEKSLGYTATVKWNPEKYK